MKTGLLFMIIFAAVIVVNGQGGTQRSTPEERTKRVVDTITTVLKLDHAQQTSAQTTFMEYYKESDKLREAMQAGTPPDKSQFETLSTDRDEKLKKFLSADQFKKYKDDLEPAIATRSSKQGTNGNN